ncbi:MAG: hypothetical protein V1824_03725 [archaeon]
MKIVFDTGVLISFSDTCLISILHNLKEKFDEFILAPAVKFESLDKSNQNMRFKLSTYRIRKQMDSLTFTVYKGSKELENRRNQILEIANSLFSLRGHDLNIMHYGEAECLALLSLTNAKYLAIDERTTRMLLEEPNALIDVFTRKYNTSKISFDKKRYNKLKELIGEVYVIRSSDLIAFSYENNLCGNAVTNKDELKAALYALKFSGCSVSFEEIEEYIGQIR